MCVIRISEYLRNLGKDKIVLAGHSFGSRLGVDMRRPDPISSMPLWAPARSPTKFATSVTYDALLKKAQTGNQQPIDELRRVGPPPYAPLLLPWS